VKVSLLASEGKFDSLDIVVMSTLFVVVFAMWWSYFDDVPDAGLSQRAGPFQLWFVAQLAFQVSVVGIAVGFGDLVDLDHGSSMDLDRTLLTVSPIITALLGLALVGACTRRRPTAPLLALRLGAAAVFAVIGVVTWAVDWLGVEPTAVLLAAFALVQAGAADRLLRRTQVPAL
jgi:low temperature requirement protein LtrA